LGRKPVTERKHLYICLAGLILVLFLGSCSSLEQNRLAGDLRNAGELYARGDFEGALTANHNILVLAKGKPPGDEALFNMGLIYASSKYAKKDYKKSMAFFQRVIREYPQSSQVPEARTWVGVLEVIEKSRQVDIELERKKKKLVR
jgi:outer membrane protein assembly factor BamD (BamD/ComL family)